MNINYRTTLRTTSVNESLPIWAQNLELSPIFTEHVSFKTAITLRSVRLSSYVLSIIVPNYGLTDTGLYEAPSTSCYCQDASLNLTCTHSCFIDYDQFRKEKTH